MFTALILGLLGFLGAALTSGLGAGLGYKNTKDTNESNLDIARETNAANVEQANLAYQRSLPTNQVRNLMDAGMSKGAALQSLAGGGSYSAPVLNGSTAQPFQPDLSGMSSAFERLGNIPVNVEQQKMIQAQRLALQKDTEIKEHAEQRAREQHTFDMWQKQYGQKGALALDTASKLVHGKLLESGREIDSFNSYNDMIRTLGLQNEPIIRDLPHSARVQLQDSVRAMYEESRAQQSQDNQNRAAEDTHQESILEREKVREAIIQGRAHFNEWKSESDVRKKEARLRDITSDIKILANEVGLADEEAKLALSYIRDSDGKLKKDDIAKQLGITVDVFDAFWTGIFKVIPLSALGKSLLSDVIKIGF